ncbi:hypothetical protein GCM10017559_69360 [Streptosporangium longisporum]|uniref:Uncharacterized protein n=1 Tax=Streptosporangium longisporum TaxID=46187 RepID=A0ABP6L4E5_9ACTN
MSGGTQRMRPMPPAMTADGTDGTDAENAENGEARAYGVSPVPPCQARSPSACFRTPTASLRLSATSK